MTSSELPHIHIVGAGRVGGFLARALADQARQITSWTRSRSRWERLPAELQARCQVGSALNVPSTARIVLLCVPDDALARIVNALATTVDREPPRLWLHVSGVSPVSVLHPLGPLIGAMHPLQSIPTADSPVNTLTGAVLALSGCDEALAFGRAFASSVGARELLVPDSARASYHAAAVLAGNGVFALLDAAASLAAGAGLDSQVLLHGLCRLAQTSVANVDRVGLHEALTGPAVRGDAGTLLKHRLALGPGTDSDALYVLLARRLVDLAEHAGQLDMARAAAVRSVLEDQGQE
jgi:predicted short-subunit dehydrogenase-like oxidoreductase (DUF2520 family)